MTPDQEIDIVLSAAGDLIKVSGDSTAPAEPCQVMEQDIVEQNEAPSPGTLINVKSVLVRASRFPELASTDVVNIKRNGEEHFTEFRVLGPPRRIQDGRMYEFFLGVVDG